MRFAYLAILLLALSACAAIHRQEAADSEVLLRQAGFQTRAVDSPERQQDLVKMPSRQIVERDENGAAVYTFADPDNCHCLYVGGQKEYAKLQELRQQRIDDHNQLARRSSFEGGTSDLWGPWKPEGLVVK